MIDTTKLRAVLEGLKRIPCGRLPILDGILVERQREGIVLTRTDLEMTYRAEFRCDSHAADFSAVFPSVAQLAGQLKGHKGSTDISASDGWIHVNDDSVRAIGTADEFPDTLPAPDMGGQVTRVELWALVGDLGRLAYATDPPNPKYRMLESLCPHDGQSRIVATNGHRIAIRGVSWLPDKIGEHEFPGHYWLMHSSAANWIVSVWGNRKRSLRENPVVDVGFHPGELGKISFRLNGEVFTAKLQSAFYPDYSRVLRNVGAGNFRCNRQEWIEGLERVFSVIDDDCRGAVFELQSGRLKMSVEHPERGQVEAVVDAKESRWHKGPDRWILNVFYLLDTLKRLPWKDVYVDIGAVTEEGQKLFYFLPEYRPKVAWWSLSELHGLTEIRP